MEESSDLQSEEHKVSMEKNKKRRLKTPAQVFALEKFYNEHKYPTEEMKLELAEELLLTEKQISGWFCHRRLKDKRLLKDEACANGRQDHSSGVVQDRGSGLGQDSCGSTKHGDYRYLDLKEVESHGLHNHEFSVAGMAYGHRNHYTENVSVMDDTSSESSSSLQEQLFPEGPDPCNMEPSGYLTTNGARPALNPKGAVNMGYKPSGYLKVKGEIENAAITAVKKQLGRHYQEDGPLLSVEFDPIPPGTFECQTADPVHESYYVANTAIPTSPEISAVKRQSSLSTDKHNKKSHPHIKQRPTFHGYKNSLPGRNSSMDLYEDSVGEASAYNSTKNHKMGSKLGIKGMRSDFASNHSDHYEKKNVISKQTDILLHCYDNNNIRNVQRSEYAKSKASNSLRSSQKSVDTEERGLSKRTAKEEKFDGGRKARKQYRDSDGIGMLSNEITVTKQVKVDALQQYDVKQAPVAEIEPRKNQRSGAQMPSSFSEDETAETGYSSD